MELAIVIPARNEARTIHGVVSHARRYGPVVVVDDGSDDDTGRLAREAGAVVLRHLVNLGKGAALKTGCDYVVRHGASTLIMLDADAQHDPHLIPQFVHCLKNHSIVFGYRSFSGEMPGILRFGNLFLNTIAHLLYGVKLRDTQCGYRAFSADTYRRIRWRSHDYSVESEMITHVGKHRLPYTEVPIHTIYHDRYKGTTVLDGVKIMLKMLWWRVS